MKSLFIALALCIVGTVAHAQNGTSVKLPLRAGDTIVNTGTTTRILKFTGAYSGANIQINVSLVSGTGAGTLTLSGSLDGVNYKTIGSAYTITNTASQSTQFSVAAPLPTYIKVAGAGSGTEVAILTYWYNDPTYNTR